MGLVCEVGGVELMLINALCYHRHYTLRGYSIYDVGYSIYDVGYSIYDAY